jgi:hypothetical protein
MVGEIRADIEVELTAKEREIASLRIYRDRNAHQLEKALRERERLYRHLAAINREDSNSERRSA